MIADNWTTCLGCENATEAEIAAYRRRARDAYGLPFEEYERIRVDVENAIDKLSGKKREETFREDYEFYGAEEGVVHVSYSGQCTVCGYGTSFEEEHPIPEKVKAGNG